MEFGTTSPDASQSKPVEFFNFNDFEAEGESILAAARGEADRIKSTIEAEKKAAIEVAVEQAKKEGYKAGFQEGKEEGFAHGEKQGKQEVIPKVAPAIQAFDQAANDLESKIDALVQDAQNDFVELVKVIALKVIHKYLETDDEVIARAMDSISEFIVHKNSLVLNVNPEDREIAIQWLRDNKGRFDKLKSLKVNDNEEIARGGCSIITPEGGMDLTIETAIEALVEEL